MSTLIVHNISQELLALLKQRAESSKRSVEDEVVDAMQRGLATAQMPLAENPDWSSRSKEELQKRTDAAYQDGGVDENDRKLLDDHFQLHCSEKENEW